MIRALPYYAAFIVCVIIYGIGCSIRDWRRHRTTAPISGFDRAGGPYNGHSARKGKREGAAATAGILLAKNGNGASHSRSLSSDLTPSSSGNAAAFSLKSGDA